MAKIAFAIKNIYYLDGMKEKPSYINTLTDDIYTIDISTIKNRILSEVNKSMPNNGELITPDNMNIKYTSYINCEFIINFNQLAKYINYGNLNKLQKLNYFVVKDKNEYKYYYIKKNECLNINGIMHITGTLDIGRTKGADVIMLNDNVDMLVERLLPDRYIIDNNRYIYSGIVEQSFFGIKDEIMTKFKPSICKYINNSYVPGDDPMPSLIHNYDILNKLYGPNNNFWDTKTGFSYSLITNKSAPALKTNVNGMNSGYGLPNFLYIYPLMKTSTEDNSMPTFIKPEIYAQLKELLYIKNYDGTELKKTDNMANISNNLIRVLNSSQINAYVVSMNKVPKPIIDAYNKNSITIAKNGLVERRNFLLGYKNSRLVKDNTVYNTYNMYKGTSPTAHQSEGGLKIGVKNFALDGNFDINQLADPVPYNYSTSALNYLSDERCDCSYLKKYFTVTKEDIRNRNVPEPVNFMMDNVLIKYKHKMNNNEINISPQYYYYKNYDVTGSIYILGYQFIQPQGASLVQGVNKGIYEKNGDGTNIMMTTYFSPETQLIGDKMAAYMTANKSSINMGLANNNIKLLSSVMAPTMKTYGNTDNVIKSSIGSSVGLDTLARYYVSTNIISGTLEDIGRLPNDVYSPEPSLQLTTTTNGTYAIYELSDAEKKLNIDYIKHNGYPYNNTIRKFKNKIFFTREYYNTTKTNNSMIGINQLNDNIIIKKYFSDLLDNGIILYHLNADFGILTDKNVEVLLIKDAN